jgi:hypothetical protein
LHSSLGKIAPVSYDLEVFAPRGLSADALRDLVVSVPQLKVGEFDDARGWCTVTRGARERYCFTVDGPVGLEAEDVPDEVTAALLGAEVVFYVTVEGSAAADVPFAVRFSRQLAGATDGAVLDKQTGKVWAKGVGRTVKRPDPGRRISAISLAWYTLFTSVDADFGADYVALCRRFLPEALPRRFGEYEPLQSKLTDVGDDGFARAWREASSLLFFAASPPCITGSIYAGPGEQRPRPMWNMHMRVHIEPLATDPRWREGFQRFFVAIAERLHAFYASAEVTREQIWNGRSMWMDGASEFEVSPARIEGWMGLPPYPTWWAWYGSPYRREVENRLQGGQVVEHPAGLLHVLAPEPLDRDELTRRVTTRRGLRRVAEWAPRELVAQLRPHDQRVLPLPLDRAPQVPPPLV